MMIFVVVSMIVVLVLTDVPDLTVRVNPIFPENIYAVPVGRLRA